MRYRNRLTGTVFETDARCAGEHWEALDAPAPVKAQHPAEKKAAKPAAKKAAPKKVKK